MARSGATLSLNILHRKNATSITLSPERRLHFEPTRTLAAEVKKRAGLHEPLIDRWSRTEQIAQSRQRTVNWLPRRIHEVPPFAGHALDADVEWTPKDLAKPRRRAPVRVKKLSACDPVHVQRGETVTLQATSEDRSPVPAAG
jgi:hypothetical protein